MVGTHVSGNHVISMLFGKQDPFAWLLWLSLGKAPSKLAITCCYTTSHITSCRGCLQTLLVSLNSEVLEKAQRFRWSNSCPSSNSTPLATNHSWCFWRKDNPVCGSGTVPKSRPQTLQTRIEISNPGSFAGKKGCTVGHRSAVRIFLSHDAQFTVVCLPACLCCQC